MSVVPKIKEINANHKDVINDIAYNFYGDRMATCSRDKSVKIWDEEPKDLEIPNEKKKWIRTSSWKAHSASVWKVTWALPEFGEIIATCSFDRTATVWEEEDVNGKKKWVRKITFNESTAPVTDVKFGPKVFGLQLATCSADGFIRIYKVLDLMNHSRWEMQEEMLCKFPCSCLSWYPSMKSEQPSILAVASDDRNPANGGKIFIYEYSERYKRWKKTETIRSVTEAVHHICFAPGGMPRNYQQLAVATTDVRIITITPLPKSASSTSDLTKLEVKTIAQFGYHGGWRVAWNILGTTLVSSGEDKCIRFFRMVRANIWEQHKVLDEEGKLIWPTATAGSSGCSAGCSQTNYLSATQESSDSSGSSSPIPCTSTTTSEYSSSQDLHRPKMFKDFDYFIPLSTSFLNDPDLYQTALEDTDSNNSS